MSTHSINQALYLARIIVRSFATTEVRVALGPVGLTVEEIERGNTLLSTARRLVTSFRQRVRLTPAVIEVVGWEHRRFPLMRAVLDEVDGDLGRIVFDGVDTSSNPKVLYSVELVTERLVELAESAVPADVLAWKALERHGITKEELVAIAAKSSSEAPFEIQVDASAGITMADRDRAIDALNAFRTKWARIARATIDDGMLLRAMGARGRRALTVGEEEPPADTSPSHEGAAAPVNAGKLDA